MTTVGEKHFSPTVLLVEATNTAALDARPRTLFYPNYTSHGYNAPARGKGHFFCETLQTGYARLQSLLIFFPPQRRIRCWGGAGEKAKATAKNVAAASKLP